MDTEESNSRTLNDQQKIYLTRLQDKYIKKELDKGSYPELTNDLKDEAAFKVWQEVYKPALTALADTVSRSESYVLQTIRDEFSSEYS